MSSSVPGDRSGRADADATKATAAAQVQQVVAHNIASVREHLDRSMAAVASKSLPQILDGYAPAGVHDELVRAGLQIGAHWQPLLTGLEALSHEQRLNRIERI